MIEFSREGYRELLRLAKLNDYRSILFSEVGYLSAPRGLLLLRHDVDVSMDYACELAFEEANHGVRATYFVMFRSPLYNLWARHNTRLLWKIRDLGHEIGLHYDASFAEQESLAHEDEIAFEASALEHIAGVPISAFSLHQPTASIVAQHLSSGNMINTYRSDHMAGFEYISDSNRDWRGKDPAKILCTRQNLHLLAHPMWWICEAPGTQGCWDEAIELNFRRSEEQILQTERAYGARRRFSVARPTAANKTGEPGGS